MNSGFPRPQLPPPHTVGEDETSQVASSIHLDTCHPLGLRRDFATARRLEELNPPLAVISQGLPFGGFGRLPRGFSKLNRFTCVMACTLLSYA